MKRQNERLPEGNASGITKGRQDGGRRAVRGGGLDGFLERVGEEAAEVAWQAAGAWLERAARESRDGHFGRFRYYPQGELRRLRRDVKHALELARFAVALQEEENELVRALTSEARAQAEAADTRRRREQTREAERVRLENGRKRRSEGR